MGDTLPHSHDSRSRSRSRSSNSGSPPKSLMENLLGLLRVRIKRGVNLAVRDVRSSDPYVVIKMANQVPLSSASSSFFFFIFFLYNSLTENNVKKKNLIYLFLYVLIALQFFCSWIKRSLFIYLLLLLFKIVQLKALNFRGILVGLNSSIQQSIVNNIWFRKNC